ncbi:MAG: hypothetical protein MUC60_15905 [Oscillatoria sp. Prado101]|nr:hypothetical protein [Oscillatoria sp. Prado101]
MVIWAGIWGFGDLGTVIRYCRRAILAGEIGDYIICGPIAGSGFSLAAAMAYCGKITGQD